MNIVEEPISNLWKRSLVVTARSRRTGSDDSYVSERFLETNLSILKMLAVLLRAQGILFRRGLDLLQNLLLS